jgi:antitoxin CptB
MPNRAKIQWLCRRGTRELDLLLQGYLTSEFDGASAEEKNAFLQLLNREDTELLDYLFARATPENPRQAQLVSKLRTFLVPRS